MSQQDHLKIFNNIDFDNIIDNLSIINTILNNISSENLLEYYNFYKHLNDYYSIIKIYKTIIYKYRNNYKELEKCLRIIQDKYDYDDPNLYDLLHYICDVFSNNTTMFDFIMEKYYKKHKISNYDIIEIIIHNINIDMIPTYFDILERYYNIDFSEKNNKKNGLDYFLVKNYVDYNFIDILNILYVFGTDLYDSNTYGQNIFHFITKDAKNANSLLEYLSYEKIAELINYLTDIGVDINLKDSMSKYPLDYLIDDNIIDYNIIKIFLDNNAICNLYNIFKNAHKYPLNLFENIIDIYCKIQGLNKLNIIYDNNRTPIHLVTIYNCKIIFNDLKNYISILESFGVNPNHKDINNKTYYDYLVILNKYPDDI